MINMRTGKTSFSHRQELGASYSAVRRGSVCLTEHLSHEDCCAQSMPDASPLKWHLAHTTWFFETFILERYEPEFRPFHPAFRMLFNSYYNGVGDKPMRAQRGLLTRPSFEEVLAYRKHVDARMEKLMQEDLQRQPALAGLIELGMQHEQQHQELMLTDVKHLLWMHPLKPAYSLSSTPPPAQRSPMRWLSYAGGIVEIGHAGEGFYFDNETPRHKEFLEPYELASTLVSNEEFLAFIEEGGYRNSSWWLSEGWDWACANRLAHPLYWQQDENGAWREFTLHGMQALDRQAPVMHLSYFEADAYARWAGARLPTEAEWENAAALHGENTLLQLFGTCWQWTSSSYAPYPGYQAASGAIGEYNGKFMVNQYVLRGSSWATPAGHARITYRNFFPAAARWQFCGLRLARSSLQENR